MVAGVARAHRPGLQQMEAKLGATNASLRSMIEQEQALRTDVEKLMESFKLERAAMDERVRRGAAAGRPLLPPHAEPRARS